MEENVLEQILEGSTKPTDLPLETLREITNNFSTDRVIGGGGFATVYKGVLRNSNSVAVKKIMSNMTINEKLFHREVGSLMEVNHQNIVRFLGFCSNTVETPVKNPEAEGYIFAEKRERLLCFEYINNGSLDNYITDELRGLDWDTRFQIIKGISMGLCYLHMEKRILHMDLKPANILLDNQMVPKITDFGLSRPVGNSQTTSTDHYCTLGYAAPENMFLGGRMTVKSDIYSLGVIIIELVTGHKGFPYNSENVLRRWRHRWKKSGSEMQLAYQQVTKCLEIGLLCQAVESNKRPFISKIVSEIGEMENMNNYDKNVDEPIVAKIHPPYLEDDMLGIEPLDLWFAEHNNKHTLSCSVELSNNAGGFIAFEIRTTSPLPYSIVPNNGMVAPRSKLIVDITRPTAKHDNDMEALQYGTKQYTDNFIVRSIKVDDSLTTKDLNEGIFDTGMVDEVHLNVVSDNQLVAPCTHEEPEEILYADIAPAISPQFTSCSPDPNPQPVCNPLFKSLMHLLFQKRKMKPIFMKNGGPGLEKANNIMIYRREDLRPILKSGNFIGKGVFGEVYKGYLDNRLVAVKKPITNCLAHNEQFANEVIIQSQVIHKNIVRLIGCCLEVDIPMLVYEFLSKGSLNDTLHNNNRTPLDLDVRLNIAAESAEGLAYMHSKTGRTILHGDVKPANILLDDDYVPKISDFGISRLIAGYKELTTSVIGDRSYMDPVYLQTGLLTEKSDVYSFGVVVLELVSRRKATYSDNNSLVRNFLDAHKKEKIPIELFDKEFAEPGDLELLGSLAGLAMDCLNLDVDERPAMTDVAERLLILKRSRK